MRANIACTAGNQYGHVKPFINGSILNHLQQASKNIPAIGHQDYQGDEVVKNTPWVIGPSAMCLNNQN